MQPFPYHLLFDLNADDYDQTITRSEGNTHTDGGTGELSS
jgi:hypothetical protein